MNYIGIYDTDIVIHGDLGKTVPVYWLPRLTVSKVGNIPVIEIEDLEMDLAQLLKTTQSQITPMGRQRLLQWKRVHEEVFRAATITKLEQHQQQLSGFMDETSNAVMHDELRMIFDHNQEMLTQLYSLDGVPLLPE